MTYRFNGVPDVCYDIVPDGSPCEVGGDQCDYVSYCYDGLCRIIAVTGYHVPMRKHVLPQLDIVILIILIVIRMDCTRPDLTRLCITI